MEDIRSNKADIIRRLKQKIYNLIDTDYKDIIQKQNIDINPNNYKPMLTKYFNNNTNFDLLLRDLHDLGEEYKVFETDDLSFKDLVKLILNKIEMSKIGAQLDIKNKHVKNFKEFKMYEATRDSTINFILDFGMFISMNLISIENYSIDEKSKLELTKLLSTLRKPIINNMTYFEILNDLKKNISNPKFLSALLLQIRNLLIYIEPRINNFVKNGDIKTNWLNKISNFKKTYTEIIK